MNNKVSIFHINNSGLMFCADKNMIMIDGVVEDTNAFGIQNPKVKNQIKEMFGKFAGNRVMIFTHCHNDHFDDFQTSEYIREGLVDTLILPHDKKNASKSISMEYFNNKRRVYTVSENRHSFNIKTIKIKMLRTTHIKYEGNNDILHYCIFLEIENSTYIIFGDTDAEIIEKILKNEKDNVDGIFVAPVALGKKKWVNKIDGAMSDCMIYVYHLPDCDMDKYGYRKFILQKYQQYKTEIPKIKVITENMSYIE